MQENKRLGIFGTLNYEKLKDMTMDERKLAVTNSAKEVLSRKTKDGKGPQIPDDEPFKFAEPRKPSKPNPELEKKLYDLGFRPFGYEW